jgi:chromosomal replication initiation ATPase DnaA
MSTTKQQPIEDVITEITSGFYGIDLEEFKKNKGRFIDHETAFKKHVCYYLIRQYTFKSYDSIAAYFQVSTCAVKHGFNKVEGYLTYNSRTITDVAKIKKLIDNFTEISN